MGSDDRAAVGREDLADVVAAVVAGEEGHRCGDLVGRPQRPIGTWAASHASL